jgi:hypothetical protein
VNNRGEDRRNPRTRPYDRRETPDHDNRFEGRQRTYSNERRYPSAPSGKQRESRNYQQSEQFEGDYEQFDYAPSRQPRNDRQKEEQSPQVQAKSVEKSPEVERHVTPLPDGRVLKGSRPAQRKNAQFWTEISQDTEELVNQVHTPAETTETVADEQAQTDTLAVEPSAPTTRVVSSRARAAKRAASAARKGKIDKPRSSGPKPSQRGFKWPSSPSQP